MRSSAKSTSDPAKRVSSKEKSSDPVRRVSSKEKSSDPVRRVSNKEKSSDSAKRISKKERERVERILQGLDTCYGTDLRCYLNYETPWQLLVAVILSAQCTDARVNLITKDLFVKYPTLDSLAEASLSELEEDIHSAGFYHNKAKNIIACAGRLRDHFHGEVPSSIEDLTSLAGVGRKTANVIRGTVYGIDSIVVDTHVGRISRKLGLTKNTDPEQVEYDLERILPKDHWININFQLIAHGRSVCTARKPDCANCILQNECVSANAPKKEDGLKKCQRSEERKRP